jgi:hypothetical protein
MRRLPIGMIAGAAAIASAGVAAAQERPGRYTMSPIEGGAFVRLDTETGAMSVCRRSGEAWDCQAMADSSRPLQEETDRLKAQNKELQAEVKRLEETLGLGDRKSGEGEQKRAERPGGERPGGDRPGGQFRMPSEDDIDKAIDYVERMFKKFRDKLKDLEGSEKRGPTL